METAILSPSINTFGGHDDGMSIQGASHKKTDKPCQDYGGHYRCADYAVAVVCDGHGGDPYFRSDRGSTYGVEVVLNAIYEFMQGKAAFLKKLYSTDNDIIKEELSSQAIQQLIKNIIYCWSERVRNDLYENPFTEDELKDLPDKYLIKYGTEGINDKFSAYGTTLIAIIYAPEFWFGIRIGDGRCVSISKDGSIEDPIPWNEKCFLNTTVSLCDEKAFENFRYCFHTDNFPVAIYVGTDGVDDSFGVYGNDERLFNFYRNLTRTFDLSGFDGGKKELAEYLPVLTEKGSGDDISISGILDLEGIKELFNTNPSKE
ncbi:MAG: protein phosphatase 2C domain-containing protein [Dysgonamonadaceae bacterium]|nr:protein phosphatase 2C domain-containing protein [Dysgonamonadaceae bacterium]